MELHLSDFTLDNYRRLIKLAKDNYRFIGYEEVHSSENFCLWRHDVDFSIEDALKLSAIENSEGVKATYFLQLSSSFYNVFDPEVLTIIRQIVENGHQIGLHFYADTYNINNQKNLVNHLIFEKNVLEHLFNHSVEVFSFHNPTERLLKFDEFEYGGIINTYARFFKENVSYCSDSNGYWRHDRLEDFLHAGHKNIQILTHPVWWQEKEMYPRDKILKTAQGIAENNMAIYDRILAASNRLNVSKNSGLKTDE